MNSIAREPAIGERYINRDGQIFEVIAVDDVAETVELQYENGAVEAMDFDDWYGMQPKSVDAAADWDDSFNLSDDDSY